MLLPEKVQLHKAFLEWLGCWNKSTWTLTRPEDVEGFPHPSPPLQCKIGPATFREEESVGSYFNLCQDCWEKQCDDDFWICMTGTGVPSWRLGEEL